MYIHLEQLNMSGRELFQTLRDRMSPPPRANADAKAAALREDMKLAELRQAHEPTREGPGETSGE